MHVDGYLPLLYAGIRVLVLFALGYLLMMIINRSFRAIRTYSVRMMTRNHGVLDIEAEKRASTVTSVIRRTLLTVLWAALVLMGLQELGFKIDALLAGAGISAGIIGVAVGFGAQNVIKDIISGLFLIIENQIRINDVAVINGIGGAVEEINLRTTILRAENGAVHIIPNGSIQTLANLTRGFSYYVFDIALNYGQDGDKAIQILRGIASAMRTEQDYRGAILDELEVMGVDRLTTTGVQLKARIKTLPMKQWAVGREMNRRIWTQFAAAGVDLGTSPTVVQLAGEPKV